MTTKYQMTTGEIVPTNAGAGPFFPIYFCVECNAPNAAFGIARADGRVNYCGWEFGRPVCVGKGKTAQPQPVVPKAPW